MHRKLLLSLLAAAIACAPATAAFAGDASATALGVDGVVTVSSTSASDDGGQATGLAVLGQEVAGGDDTVLSTAELGVPAEVVEVAVLETTETPDSATASVARVTVADQGEARVLSSSSTGGSEPTGSTEALTIGGHDYGYVHLLISRVDQTGGTTAVADLDGTRLASSDDIGDALCDSDLLLFTADLLCITVRRDSASGGVAAAPAGDNATVEVVQASAGDGSPRPVSDPPSAPEPTPAPNPSPVPVPAPVPTPVAAPAPAATPDASTTSALPRAGVAAAGLLAMAMSLLGLGAELRRRSA